MEREHAVNGSGVRVQISVQQTRTSTCVLYKRPLLVVTIFSAKERGTAVEENAMEQLIVENPVLTS